MRWRARRRSARSATTVSRSASSQPARRPAPPTRSSSGRSRSCGPGPSGARSSCGRRAWRPSCTAPTPTARWAGSTPSTCSSTSPRCTGCRGTRSCRRATSRRARRSPWRAPRSSGYWRSSACGSGAWTNRAMSDTFFSGAPHWRWLIILYFFVGGLAGGACFLAALLDWFGRPEDRPVVRTGYYVAAWGAILSGLFLTIDLGRPPRFWHMLFQSANFPTVMFKTWSPISFGAWAILLFGLFSVLSALGAMAEEGRLQTPALRAVGGVIRGGIAKLVAGIGGLVGFFVAGHTGSLLSVTKRPIRADSPWLGAPLGTSGASTGAEGPILAAPGP